MAAGLITSAIQVGAAAIAADITKIRLHTADPTANSGTTNLTTAADQTVTSTSLNGVVTVPSTSFTGGAASGACTWVSLWSGTTYRGAYPLTGDQTFNTAGEYIVDSVTITGSSS
jgi:hypothetical protein